MEEKFAQAEKLIRENLNIKTTMLRVIPLSYHLMKYGSIVFLLSVWIAGIGELLSWPAIVLSIASVLAAFSFTALALAVVLAFAGQKKKPEIQADRQAAEDKIYRELYANLLHSKDEVQLLLEQLQVTQAARASYSFNGSVSNLMLALVPGFFSENKLLMFLIGLIWLGMIALGKSLRLIYENFHPSNFSVQLFLLQMLYDWDHVTALAAVQPEAETENIPS